ncbi:hypothetical protein JCM8097_004499 [Rhodosporidiobolus ruineniae]
MLSAPALSRPSLSSSPRPPLLSPSSDLPSAPAASRGSTSPSQQHPAPPPASEDDARPRCEAQPGAPADDVMDTGEEGLEGAAGASSGRRGYGPGESFDVDEFSAPGELGSAAVAAAAREAPVLDLTASDDETDEEAVGWEVWQEALEEIVGEETPAERAWREDDEQVTLPLARFCYAAAAAVVVSLKRARSARPCRLRHYDILADTLLALRATARDEARYERTSQHRRRVQHRQHTPLPQ